MTENESRPAGTTEAAPETPATASITTVPHLYRHPAVRAAVREAEQQATFRRARVLAHPDIAEQLTRPPLRYTRPEVWTGYVPPARGPYGAKWPDDYGRGHGVDEAINASPNRAALIAILQAVVEREQGAADAA